MKIAVCDVCDARQSVDEPMIEMIIPSEFMDEENTGFSTRVDVCSWHCVQSIVRGAFNDEEIKAEEPPEDIDQDEKLVMIPQKKKERSVADYSPEELAKYTEQVTGVRRRY